MNQYEISIEHIYISPGHNFYKNKMGTAGTNATEDVDKVNVLTDLGLEGDRFAAAGEDRRGQVTFFADEVYQAIRSELECQHISSGVFRRNIVVKGVALNQLVGQRFEIDGMTFEGTMECSPCKWMDIVVAPGARKFLVGRGGLRAKVIKGGELKVGAAFLSTEATFSADDIINRLEVSK